MMIYEKGAAYALERGIIVADTKFEFGLDVFLSGLESRLSGS